MNIYDDAITSSALCCSFANIVIFWSLTFSALTETKIESWAGQALSEDRFKAVTKTYFESTPVYKQPSAVLPNCTTVDCSQASYSGVVKSK